MLTLGLMTLTQLLWPLGQSVWSMALVLVPWALGCFAANSAQQARLVNLSPSWPRPRWPEHLGHVRRPSDGFGPGAAG